MVKVIRAGEGTRLDLPGRTSVELISAAMGARGVTLRIVEIPPDDGSNTRQAHAHDGFEECIYVLAGEGITSSASGDVAISAGDAILVPPGEPHMTRNTGAGALRLACFFPLGDIGAGTDEPR